MTESRNNSDGFTQKSYILSGGQYVSMKNILPFAAAAAVLLCLVLSAGCIGETTSDIVLGDKTIGKLTLNPEDIFGGGSLTDIVDVDLDLFGKDKSGTSDTFDLSSLGGGDMNLFEGLSGDSSDGDMHILGEVPENYGDRDVGGLKGIMDSLSTAGTNLETLINGLEGMLE